MKWFAFPAILALLLQPVAAHADKTSPAPEQVTLLIRDVIERPALWFNAGGKKAVVLVHQSGSTAESWTPLASFFLSKQISSIVPAGNSGEDVEVAVGFLKDRELEDITLIGASLGGGAVQQATEAMAPNDIDRVILLSTATGPALETPDLPKLFIHARQDFFINRAVRSFEKASEPKTLLELPGSLHGQELLQGQQRRLLEQVILNFIQD